MSLLRVRLFGGIHVTHDGWQSEVKATRRVKALLAYLLLNRQRFHPRELLAGLFWGDQTQEHARKCLNTALWRLRSALETKGIRRGTYLVTTATGDVGFNRESDYWLDAEVFEGQIEQVVSRPIYTIQSADSQKLEDALQLYTGELLEGFYDDWALREQERLRYLYLSGLAHLMQYSKYCKDYEKSLTCGRRILQCDPLREDIHREIMRLYVENGQRALAVRQYETCRNVLQTELDVGPMEETRALYAQIREAPNSTQAQATLFAEPPSPQHALKQLRLATQGLDRAREQLSRALQLMERSSGQANQ